MENTGSLRSSVFLRDTICETILVSWIFFGYEILHKCRLHQDCKTDLYVPSLSGSKENCNPLLPNQVFDAILQFPSPFDRKCLKFFHKIQILNTFDIMDPKHPSKSGIMCA